MTRHVDLPGVKKIYFSDTLLAFRNSDSMSTGEKGTFPKSFWEPREENVIPRSIII